MQKKYFSLWITQAWYQGNPLLTLLRPLSLLFGCLSAYRKKRLLPAAWLPPVPTIVVGNITVGGTGKTPAVIYLAKQLQDRGLQPVILSRGYGGHYEDCTLVRPGDSANKVGDEALLLQQQTGAAVVVGRNRVDAAQYALNHIPAQPATFCRDPRVLLCDDGLQHYRLGRHIEIAVIDAARAFGNRKLLPEGPLREPVSRLAEVDLILVHGDQARLPMSDPSGVQADRIFSMRTIPERFYPAGANSVHGSRDKVRKAQPEYAAGLTVQQFQQRLGCNLKVVAATGNPSRFFISLQQLGFQLDVYEFPDHHPLESSEIMTIQHSKHTHLPVVMTSKDAVKCQNWSLHNVWYLDITTELEEGFMQKLIDRIQEQHTHMRLSHTPA